MGQMKEELALPFRIVQDNAKRVATVWHESKVDVNVDEYVQKFKPHMMEVVNAWCNVCLLFIV